jgi:hypothetical protein
LFLIITGLGQENRWFIPFFAHSFQLFSFFWLGDWTNVFTNLYFWPKSLGWLYSMHVSASSSSPKGSDFEIFTHITYGFFFRHAFTIYALLIYRTLLQVIRLSLRWFRGGLWFSFIIANYCTTYMNKRHITEWLLTTQYVISILNLTL